MFDYINQRSDESNCDMPDLVQAFSDRKSLSSRFNILYQTVICPVFRCILCPVCILIFFSFLAMTFAVSFFYLSFKHTYNFIPDFVYVDINIFVIEVN